MSSEVRANDDKTRCYRPSRRDALAAYAADAVLLLFSPWTRAIIRDAIKEAVIAETTPKRAPAPGLDPRWREVPGE